MAEHAPQSDSATLRGQRFQIPHLARAEHEHAPGTKIRVESREGETCLLRMRDGDLAFKAGRAGEQFEIEDAGLGDISKNGRDADTPRLGGFGHRANAM